MADCIEMVRPLARKTSSKIVMVVLDGIGGLPHPESGKTELETAHTPNLDSLAIKGICGLLDPVAPGITPGSAPGHLALFGYDPLNCNIGRGVLSALGIGVELQDNDIAARGNFCTMDTEGIITDRRAGRISTEKCAELCAKLDGQTIDGITILVKPEREHRLCVVFRGDGLSPEVNDSDPQQTEMKPFVINPAVPQAARLADIANKFLERVKDTLKDEHPANMVVLRGFDRKPQMPTMNEAYKLNAAAIAIYPMYRGLSRLLGMQVLETGPELENEFDTLAGNYDNHDFFFLHIKPTDSSGEDGDFDRKVKVIERVDRALSRLIELDPDVVVVTGDHSTPALLSGHSWHPVPVLLRSNCCRTDGVTEFSEKACITGGLGRIQGTQLMPLALANALKLQKYGA